MFLEKVIDIESLNLGNNQVLVELSYIKPKESSIIIPSGANPQPESTDFTKVEVILSTCDNIKVGDLVVDFKYNPAYNPPMKVGDRFFATAPGHDIKMWTSKENYDENRTFKKKESIIKEAAQGVSSTDLMKMESESRGLGSKYLNNRS